MRSPDDTPADVRHRLIEGWRVMSPARKAALVDAWSRDCRALAMAGLRDRHPSATETELLRRLGVLLYGETVMRELPRDEV